MSVDEAEIICRIVALCMQSMEMFALKTTNYILQLLIPVFHFI